MADKLSDRAGVGILVGIWGESVHENDDVLRFIGELWLPGVEHMQIAGVVPEGSLVPRALRVQRAVDYAAELRLSGREPEARRARVGEVIQILGLEGVGDVRVSKLSVADQFLVNVAVELLNAPTLLMVEFGRAMLEDAQMQRIFGGLRKVCKNEGVNVICMLATMEVGVFNANCDVVYCLKDGDFVKQKGA